MPHCQKRLLPSCASTSFFWIHGKVLSWIASFLVDRRQLNCCLWWGKVRVFHGHVRSTTGHNTRAAIVSAICWWSAISCSRWNFGEAFHSQLPSLHWWSYRDVIEDHVTLQQDMIGLESSAKSRGMVFDPSKCYMMQIRRGRNIQSHMYMHVLSSATLRSVTSEN